MAIFIPKLEDKLDNIVKLPGFCDVHVHFREPGFSYKETILSGADAARAGGYADVCTMPNLNPVPDSLPHLQLQLDLIRRQDIVSVYPYGSITVGERGEQISDLEGLAPHVIGFSDDGVGVKDTGLMREAMQRCRALGKIIAGHCEDMQYEDPRDREWRELERNIQLSAETGCAFHACHISTAESVQLVREAKKSGLNVSCETAPHYLMLDNTQITDEGRYRMNPPIHSPADREALLEALCDGIIDMIATDHAPHTAEEKARGANGIVGLETAFPVLYTGLVRAGILSLDALVSLMADRPRARFGIPDSGVEYQWDLEAEYRIDPETFRSKGHATPFAGWPVYGKIIKENVR